MTKRFRLIDSSRRLAVLYIRSRLKSGPAVAICRDETRPQSRRPSHRSWHVIPGGRRNLACCSPDHRYAGRLALRFASQRTSHRAAIRKWRRSRRYRVAPHRRRRDLHSVQNGSDSDLAKTITLLVQFFVDARAHGTTPDSVRVAAVLAVAENAPRTIDSLEEGCRAFDNGGDWSEVVGRVRKTSGVPSSPLPTTPGPRGTPRLALTQPTKTSSIWRGSFAFGASVSIEQAVIGGKPLISLVHGYSVRRTLGSRRPWRS